MHEGCRARSAAVSIVVDECPMDKDMMMHCRDVVLMCFRCIPEFPAPTVVQESEIQSLVCMYVSTIRFNISFTT